MLIKYDYTNLEKKFIACAKKIKIYDMAKHEPHLLPKPVVKVIKKPKKIYKRQAPKIPSKNLEVGTTMISENT